MSAYVVAGVTGHVGSVVAGDLMEKGKPVQVIVRDPAQGGSWIRRGATVAVGSLDDPVFLAGVLQGTSGFFVLLPPNYPPQDFYDAQRRCADAIAAGVRQSRPPLVVMLSSLGADLDAHNGPIRGLHYFENALRATGVKTIAIRAAYFQENIINVLPAAKQRGVFPNFMPSRDFRVPMVATRDIGRLAARLITSPPDSSTIVDLAGPAYSAQDLAAKLGATLGRHLEIVDIPHQHHTTALIEAGLPAPLAEIYAELYEALGAGILQPKGDRTESGTTTIDEVLPALV